MTNDEGVSKLECRIVILSGAKQSRRSPWNYSSVFPRDSSTSLGMTGFVIYHFAIRHSCFVILIVRLIRGLELHRSDIFHVGRLPCPK